MEAPSTRPGRGFAGSFAPCALVVLLAAVAAFARSFGGGFVWDDHRFIEENQNVAGATPWLRLLTDASTADSYGAHGIVRPLRTLEFALDHALFGLSPLAFRLHSFLWHAAGALALLAILRRLLGAGWPALLGALFWAVHPVQAESVAFVSSRGDVAMGALAFASVLLALRSGGGDRFEAASLAAAGLACLYKEPGVALPVVIAALRAASLARVRLWPYVAVSAAYLVYRFLVQSGPIGHGTTAVLGGSAAGTFATMARAFGFYVAETLLPAQSLDWFLAPSPSFAALAPVAWAGFHAAALVAAVRLRSRLPLVTVSVAWFYGFLLPVANWPVFLGIPTAERFLHASLGGAALLVGWGVRSAGRAAVWPAAAAVAALGVATVQRCAMWRSDEALWSAVAADHESPREWERRAKISRKNALDLRGRALALPAGPGRDELVGQARGLFERSLGEAHHAIALWYRFEMVDASRNPLVRSCEAVAANVSYILLRNEEALFHAGEVLRIDPDADGYGHYNRAMALLALDFVPQGIDSLLSAREHGLGGPNAEIAGTLLRASAAAESAGLFETARAGYRGAIDAAPPADAETRRLAEDRLAQIAARPRSDDDARREREAIERIAARLAALPTSCPARPR